jgi:hypothetical protein
MLSLKRKPDAYLVNTGCFATAERLRYRSALGYPVNGSGELIYEAGSKALGRAQFHPDPFKYIVSIEIKIQGRVSRESAVRRMIEKPDIFNSFPIIILATISY